MSVVDSGAIRAIRTLYFSRLFYAIRGIERRRWETAKLSDNMLTEPSKIELGQPAISNHGHCGANGQLAIPADPSGPIQAPISRTRLVHQRDGVSWDICGRPESDYPGQPCNGTCSVSGHQATTTGSE